MGARFLKESNPERSQVLLAKAKQLTEDTLTLSYFRKNIQFFRRIDSNGNQLQILRRS